MVILINSIDRYLDNDNFFFFFFFYLCILSCLFSMSEHNYTAQDIKVQQLAPKWI